MRKSSTLAVSLILLALAGCSQNTTESAADAAKSAMGDVTDAASGMAADVGSGAAAVGAAASGTVGEVANKAATAADKMGDGLKKAASDAHGAIKGATETKPHQ